MALTLTANDGMYFDDGTYEASIIGVEKRASAVAGSRDGSYLRWTFEVHREGERPVELIANSSMNMGPKSKARMWIEAALGRKLGRNETVEPERYFPLACKVGIEMDEESGYARIVKVSRATTAQAPEEPAPDADDDIPF